MTKPQTEFILTNLDKRLLLWLISKVESNAIEAAASLGIISKLIFNWNVKKKGHVRMVSLKPTHLVTDMVISNLN